MLAARINKLEDKNKDWFSRNIDWFRAVSEFVGSIFAQEWHVISAWERLTVKLPYKETALLATTVAGDEYRIKKQTNSSQYFCSRALFDISFIYGRRDADLEVALPDCTPNIRLEQSGRSMNLKQEMLFRCSSRGGWEDNFSNASSNIWRLPPAFRLVVPLSPSNLIPSRTLLSSRLFRRSSAAARVLTAAAM